ncbi:MAG: hypothetical protein HGJ94_16200 [Desulfosarcina sp.]|nr:hypothetical protein [Desulfosarcina sp.]
MYRDNYITALRTELLEMVSEQLTPVAMRYGYSEVPLETTSRVPDRRPQMIPSPLSLTTRVNPTVRRYGSPISGTANFCSTIPNIPLRP